MSALGTYLSEHRERHLSELKDVLAIPSVSTDPTRAADVKRAAKWMHERLERAGCTSVVTHTTPFHPIVYGEWLGAPGRPTILVYGHYDVQPVDPVALWHTPPFEPTLRDGRIYARGSSDDKGQLSTHLLALVAHLETSGTWAFEEKVVLEGEEEVGSESVEAFLASHTKELVCDAVVVSDTAMFSKKLPSIVYGLRGLTYLEVTVRGSDSDLHSGSFGGAVINPANALVTMLAKLKDAKGKITIPGFYDRVRKLTAAERKAFGKLPHSDRELKKSIGAPDLFGEAGFTALERMWARPSLDINGIWSGFTGHGAKTVIPAEAKAKVSMRLVPDQTNAEITRKAAAYLKKIAPKAVKVTVEELHGGPAWVAPTDHPALAAGGRAMKRAFGKAPVFVREGGSIPIVSSFERRLGVPAVLMGFGLHDDNLHAPNEKFDLDQFYRGIEASAYLMEELGRIEHTNGRRSR